MTRAMRELLTHSCAPSILPNSFNQILSLLTGESRSVPETKMLSPRSSGRWNSKTTRMPLGSCKPTFEIVATPTYITLINTNAF